MKDDKTVLTPECTLLWPALFEPESFKGGEEKYRCVLLFDEGEDLDALDKAIIAARNAKFPGKDKAFYKGLRLPYRDGNEKAVDMHGKPDKASFFYNRLYVSAKTNFQPQVVDVFNRPITDPKEVYGGCRVVALLRFYGFDHLGNRGVSCSLQAIMKMAEGTPIGGGKVDTAQAFAPFIKKPDPSGLLNQPEPLDDIPY
jgi:hypothetical protein